MKIGLVVALVLESLCAMYLANRVFALESELIRANGRTAEAQATARRSTDIGERMFQRFNQCREDAHDPL